MGLKMESFMKRVIALAAAAIVCLSGVSVGQRLRSDEAAIFFKSGNLVVDKIVEISSAGLVLKTQNNGEFPLRDLWMINFITEEWNFPNERNLIEANEHYVFLKNGDVYSGRIVNFSSDQRVFEFETGDKFPIGQIRRIYFSKNVPRTIR
jgi:hypothetical protein